MVARRYQRDNQNQSIEGQTTQWPKEKGQKMIYKTLHKKLKIEYINTNPTKNRVNSGAPRGWRKFEIRKLTSDHK
jgi:hypothetical protein